LCCKRWYTGTLRRGKPSRDGPCPAGPEEYGLIRPEGDQRRDAHRTTRRNPAREECHRDEEHRNGHERRRIGGGDIRAIAMGDVDWQPGSVRVAGESRTHVRLPLTLVRRVVPWRPLAMAAVSGLVARAVARAGVTTAQPASPREAQSVEPQLGESTAASLCFRPTRRTGGPCPVTLAVVP
jgi:hypothetical protein